MKASSSHGRLALLAVAILPWSVLSQADTTETPSPLLREAEILSESVAIQIEQMRQFAFRIKNLRDQDLNRGTSTNPFPSDLIWAWGEAVLRDGNYEQNGETILNPSAPSLMEEQKDLLKKILVANASQGLPPSYWDSSSVALVPLKNPNLPYLLSFAFILPNYGRFQPKTIVVIVADALEAFPILKSLNEDRKGYIVSQTGTILSHSKPTYAGQSLLQTPIFREGITHAFLAPNNPGNSRAESEIFEASDGAKLEVAFLRPRQYPIAVVVEKEAPPTVETPWYDSLRWVIVFLLGMCVAFAVSLKRSKERSKTLSQKAGEAETSLPQKSASLPSTFVSLPSPPTPSAPTYMTPNQVGDAVTRFISNASHLRDLKVVTGLLTQTLSQICSSPILFFRYSPQTRTAVLEFEEGIEKQQSKLLLSFPLPPEAVERILSVTREGKLASLSSYEPLTKLLLSRLEVSFFEAWAVTSPGRNASPVLLGVVVIVKAGVQSALHREAIVRMMRMTGSLLERGPSAHA